MLAREGAGRLARGVGGWLGTLVAAAAGVRARLACGEVFGSHARRVLQGDREVGSQQGMGTARHRARRGEPDRTATAQLTALGRGLRRGHLAQYPDSEPHRAWGAEARPPLLRLRTRQAYSAPSLSWSRGRQATQSSETTAAQKPELGGPPHPGPEGHRQAAPPLWDPG